MPRDTSHPALHGIDTAARPPALPQREKLDLAPVNALPSAMASPGRVEETAPGYPAYALPMAVLSGLLTLVLLAFSARVLEVHSGALGPGHLDNIAAWTRLLFGFSVALMIWGVAIFPLLDRYNFAWRIRLGMLILTGLIGVGLGTVAERTLVGALGANADGLAGRKAVQLHLMTQAVREFRLPWRDIDVPPEALASPEGRAFLSALLASELRQGQDGLPRAETLRALVQTLVAQRLGTAAQVYDNVFIPSVRSLRDTFNSYVAAQTVLADQIRAIPEREQAAWSEFQDSLARQGLTASRIPRADWPSLGHEFRDAGVPLPLDWNPNDRAGFSAVYSAHLRQLANAAYDERVQRMFGTVLPPGLEWEQFVADPIVQQRWRAALDAPAGASLSPSMGFRAFTEQVYQPMIERLAGPRLSALTGPPARFAPGGPMTAPAEAAIRQITIPAAALGLLLLAAVLHGSGCVYWLGRVVLAHWRWRGRLTLLALVLAGLAVLGARSPLTRSEAFQHFEDRLADRAGPIWLGVRGAVEAERLVALWGGRIRRVVLGSYEFGLDGTARGSDDGQAMLDRLLP